MEVTMWWDFLHLKDDVELSFVNVLLHFYKTICISYFHPPEFICGNCVSPPPPPLSAGIKLKLSHAQIVVNHSQEMKS